MLSRSTALPFKTEFGMPGKQCGNRSPNTFVFVAILPSPRPPQCLPPRVLDQPLVGEAGHQRAQHEGITDRLYCPVFIFFSSIVGSLVTRLRNRRQKSDRSLFEQVPAGGTDRERISLSDMLFCSIHISPLIRSLYNSSPVNRDYASCGHHG